MLFAKKGEIPRHSFLVLFAVLLIFGFQNCAPQQLQFAEVPEEIDLGSTTPPPIDSKSCLFNGQEVKNGEAVTSYLNSSVSFGDTCRAQVRQCVEGVLSGSYEYANCSVGKEASCLFAGRTIEHGQSIAAYLTSSVGYGQNCTMQTRTCQNGVLSGSYGFSSCTPHQPVACTFDGKTVPHGGSVVGYASSTVTYGQSCSAQTRICNNGTLSGNYSYGSCVPGQPTSCILGGKTIPHGSSIIAYAANVVPVGSSCQSQSRTCSSGQLSGSYANTACSVVPVCGSAHGAVSFTVPDSSSLCRFGVASGISGVGTHESPWRWSCSYAGALHSCSQVPCSKITVRARATGDDSVANPFLTIPFNGMSFKMNGQSVVIGGGSTPSISQAGITTYSQLVSIFSGAIGEVTGGKAEMVLGGSFTWASTRGLPLQGTEMIIQGKNQKVSFQAGGFWTLSPTVGGGNGGFASDVVCKE
ncbi:MAG: hypothetical protein OM95_16285 [Bdellovibrio sp. ArHS]|nr:MAG: hypothetical protein OM95_16285 [Bdellovibrio sp. ArHS]